MSESRPPSQASTRSPSRETDTMTAVSPSSELDSTLPNSKHDETASARDVEKGGDGKSGAEVDGQRGSAPPLKKEGGEEKAEYDSDGVRMENGIPIVGITGPDDPFSPLKYSTGKKWLIIVTVSTASFCVTCCSSMVALTYKGVEKEFGSSPEVTTLGLSLFVLGLGFAPLLLGPLSEFYGRSPIYLISYFFFIIWNVMVALSHNIETWLIGRFLAGAAGAAFLSVAGGTVTDIFAPSKVAPAMGVYTASPFLGPVAGPIISGFINQHLDWRWTWYILIIWAGAEWAALILFVPETYLPALLVKKAKKLRKEGRKDVKAPLDLDERSIPMVILTSCRTPFELLATEPMAMMLCLWTSILLGILYMFFSAFNIVYGPEGYGFEPEFVGLSFAGIGIGLIAGTCCFPIWQKPYLRIMAETGKRPPPEEHLRRGLYGAVIVPLSLLWFAFTTYTKIHWIVSMIATIPFGVGVLWSFQAVFVYLVDAYRPFAASAMSANSAMRSSFAAGFPLFTTQMFHKLGTQWALGLSAFLCLAIAPFPFLFFKNGGKYRSGSKFANKEA